jgi:hypothetical protein
MKYISDYADRMSDEIEDAKYYAEKYVECKAKGHIDRATKYKELANDELKHAMVIHEIATKEIEDVSKVFVAPSEMMEKWEKAHKEYVERVAWVKQMLAM